MNTTNNISFSGSVLVKYPKGMKVPNCVDERGYFSMLSAIKQGIIKQEDSYIPVPVNPKSRVCLLVNGIEKEMIDPIIQNIKAEPSEMKKNSLIDSLKRTAEAVRKSKTTKIIDYEA